METRKKKLVLENGMSFTGIGYGSAEQTVGEIIFNTSMVGYQEIISDPSYAGEIVVMTYPLMGQYGIIEEDDESKVSLLKGLVVRECCDTPSNFRYTKSLSEELEERGIPCIAGLDTRMLTRIIRRNGKTMAAIVDETMSDKDALKLIADNKEEHDWTKKASCTKRSFARTPKHKFDVVAIDCGMKHGIVSELTKRGCNVTIVPFDSTAEEIEAFKPDGVLLSSGPGDPQELTGLIEIVKNIRGKLPIFGICLGHEIIALSYGVKVERLGCGHHGGMPVRDLTTGKIITVEHNHNFTVNEKSAVEKGLTVTFRDVAEGTVEGLERVEDRIFSVQFHPEGTPGPQESDMFDKFVKMMEGKRNA